MKTKKSINPLLIIVIAELIVICAGIYLHYSEALIADPKIGDTFISGNEVMDRLKFSNASTPAARGNAISQFNANKSNLIVVGTWKSTDNGAPYKDFDTFNYNTTVYPYFNNDVFSINYGIIKTNDNVDDNTRNIYQMVFIHNGKEVQPTSANDITDYNNELNSFAETLTFDNFKKGDDFVVIVYNLVDKNAIAFPFQVGSENI